MHGMHGSVTLLQGCLAHGSNMHACVGYRTGSMHGGKWLTVRAWPPAIHTTSQAQIYASL